MKLKLTENLLQELIQEQTTSAVALAHPLSAEPPATSKGIAEPLLGKFFQQYQQHEHFTIAVVQTQLENELELTTESVLPGVNMNFILNGRISTRFSDLPQEIYLTKAQHNLLYINNTSGDHLFHKGGLFENLHISLSEAYFKELCPPTSKASERLHTHMLKQLPALASQQHGSITLQMQQAIQGILNCEFKGAMQKLYMEAKVLELLALQLNQFELEKEKQLTTANSDKILAEELKIYLHLHYLNLPVLKELCKLFGTNEFRLKKVFREHVGCGIFTYAQQLRLQHAHELLRDEQKSITEVADLIGYSHANHFSNAFRKQFGYAPSRLKNN
ncbi:helix-turn-helix transcriptional regulator [Pontibacter sp. H249]|uniref:helix-turn-helix transcriptional regulator n=1 Tax=Pontibacter sp. H249 TaxID=3133420 RepID=UPI0030C4C482